MRSAISSNVVTLTADFSTSFGIFCQAFHASLVGMEGNDDQSDLLFTRLDILSWRVVKNAAAARRQARNQQLFHILTIQPEATPQRRERQLAHLPAEPQKLCQPQSSDGMNNEHHSISEKKGAAPPNK